MFSKKIRAYIRNSFLGRYFIMPFLGDFINKIYKHNRKNVFHLEGKNVFLYFKEVLENHKIEFWLTFGTLLGAIRNKGFISHDMDIDVGVFFKDNPPEKIEKILTDAGFVKIRENYVINKDGIEQTYRYNKISIDIFFFFKEENTDKIYSYSYYSSKGLDSEEHFLKYNCLDVIKVSFTFRGFEKFGMFNTKWLVPKNPEIYLSEQYGEDFMTPNPKWNSRNSLNEEKTELKSILNNFYEKY